MGGVQSTPDSDSLDGRRASSTASSSCFLLPRPLSSTNRVPILTASSCDDSILKLLEEVVVLAEEEDGDEVDRNDEHRTDSTDSLQDEDISSTAQHLPFRKCTRRKCSCCTPSTLPSGRIRKRLDSEDFTTLRWMPKSHSERNHSQALTYLKRTSFSEEYFVSQNEITPRSISEDSSDSSKELRMPPSASDAPLRARETSESLCDDVPSSSTARLDLPYQSNYSRLSHPNRNSQDDWCIGVDGKRDCHQKELQSRSEDYADSSITRCSLPTSHIPQVRKLRSDSIDIFAEEGYKKPLSSNCHKNRLSFLSKSFSECSLKADDSSEPFKQRSRSEDITNLRDDCSQEKVIRRCQSSTSAGKSRKILDSPTSVIHLEYPPQDIPTAANSSNNRSLLQFYRNAVQVLKEKHRHDKVGLASLYHKIGLIHHQESRYSAASCVFNHALELLSFASGCWLLEDALPFMGPEEVTLSVNLLLSRARLEHSMGNREEAKRSAKLALQAIPSLQEHSLLLAEGLVALAQTYQEDKPERAMKHFQQALDILRCRLGDNHVGVALVMYHIGNLHAQFESFDLAQLFYNESLRIYQMHGQTTDVGAVLASLGWIQLLQDQNDLALQNSLGALRCNECIPRNLASIHYQIGLIHLRQGQPGRALQILKQVLKSQRSILQNDDHIDIAKTLEAIGVAYQELSRWRSSRNFLEGALTILEHPMDLGRVQARLAHVLIGLGEDKRARRAMKRSMQYSRSQNLPTDALVLSAEQKLLGRTELRR